MSMSRDARVPLSPLQQEIVQRLDTVVAKANLVVEFSKRCDALARDGLAVSICGTPAIEILHQYTKAINHELAVARTNVERVALIAERLVCPIDSPPP